MFPSLALLLEVRSLLFGITISKITERMPGLESLSDRARVLPDLPPASSTCLPGTERPFLLPVGSGGWCGDSFSPVRAVTQTLLSKLECAAHGPAPQSPLWWRFMESVLTSSQARPHPPASVSLPGKHFHIYYFKPTGTKETKTKNVSLIV